MTEPRRPYTPPAVDAARPAPTVVTVRVSARLDRNPDPRRLGSIDPADDTWAAYLNALLALNADPRWAPLRLTIGP